jgi:hypothetical protein
VLVRLLSGVALAVLMLVPDGAGAQRTDSTRVGVTQRPGRGRAAPRAIADSLVRPPISPGRAFLYSFVAPGLGQSKLHRTNAGALFAGTELLAVAMARKASLSLSQAKQRVSDSITVGFLAPGATGPEMVDPSTGGLVTATCTGDARGEPVVPKDPVEGAPIRCGTRYTTERVEARRTQFEDWIAVLVFNHLVAGADAFVAAQLWDLPGQVSFRPAPGGAAVSASLTW